MTRPVTAIVRCGDLTQHVYATIASLLQQTRRVDEIVLVIDVATPPRAIEWMKSVSTRRGWQLVHVDDGRPGAVANAGAERAHGDYVLRVDSGFRLDHGAIELMADELDAHADAGMVVTPTLLLGP